MRLLCRFTVLALLLVQWSHTGTIAAETDQKIETKTLLDRYLKGEKGHP